MMEEVNIYINGYPKEVQVIMEKIRTVIMETAPEAEERFAYGLPGYYLLGKPLVYFGAYATHIGLYATPIGHEQFKEELSVYKQGKGSVQFPLNSEIPYGLIERIVTFRKKQISSNQ